LARRESLTEAVADGDLSVILSSHLLHDLERICDHLILLAARTCPRPAAAWGRSRRRRA
jgi:ABC-type Na+ transport system ATPase subunit NatA